jgi:hypothetical protein
MPWSLRHQFLKVIHRADLSKSGLRKALPFVCALFRLQSSRRTDEKTFFFLK